MAGAGRQAKPDTVSEGIDDSGVNVPGDAGCVSDCIFHANGSLAVKQ